MNSVKMIMFMKQINKIKNSQKEIMLLITQNQAEVLEFLLVKKIFVTKIVKKIISIMIKKVKNFLKKI